MEGPGNAESLIILTWASIFLIQYVLGAKSGAIFNCCEGPGLP